MNMEQIEIFNTGFLKPEHVKSATHFFCAAVEHECKKNRTDDLQEGYDAVLNNLVYYSRENSEKCEAKLVVRCTDDLLECFFNQKNMIPGHVYYWLAKFYGRFFGGAADYYGRHMQTYNELQKLYIERYRCRKYSEKENARTNRAIRRTISKVYRSGKYAETFKLYNKDLSEYMTHEEVESLSHVLLHLFPEAIFSGNDDGDVAARAFIIGRLQGRSETNE